MRAAELAFSRAEAAALLADGLDMRLTQNDVDRLWSRTEGWAAGLQLAALWLERSENPSQAVAAFSGSQRYVLDYLAEEVLAQQPPRRLRFLLDTSILEPFCTPLCVAVTGDPESAAHLALLQQENLFISTLDNTDEWLRYHPLFADYLRTQLAYEHPERVPELHRRAARWYAGAGLFPQAAQHVKAAADPAFTADFARRFWETAVQHGQVKQALGWYEALPPEMIEADRALVTGYCWTLHLSGRTPAMLPWLNRLDNATPASNDEGAGHHLLRSIAARQRGDLAGAQEAARQAIADAPPERPDMGGVAWNLLAATQVEATALDDAIDAFAHGIRLAQTGGNFLSAAVSTYYRTRLLLRQGRPTEADAACQLALAEGEPDTPAAGLLQLALAEIRLIANQIEEAAGLVERGCAQAATGGSIEAFKEGNLLRARVAAAQGEWTAAENALAEAAIRIHWLEDPRAQAELALEQAALALARGRLREAEWRLQAIDPQREHLLPIGRSLQDELTCRLWLALSDYGPARRKLAALIDWGQSTHSDGALIGWRALAAVADYQAGAERQAAATLADAIRTGQSTGCLRPLITPGRLLTPLLALLEQNLAYYADITETFGELQASIGSQPANPQDQPNPYEPLTRREIEIAGLIASGLSNQAIAEKLSISLNTVKKHTSNLYAKLGVTSRTQAVARLQDAHLL
jgi:LuxR family maltose regulon positive regulatory protein